MFRKIAINLAAVIAVTAGVLAGFAGPASAAEGPYKMQPYNNDYCIHPAGYSSAAVAVEQNLCEGGSNRNWIWTKANNYWKIKYRNGSKCIAVTSDTSPIRTQTCNTTAGERWLPIFGFKSGGVDYYQLKNATSGKCMAIPNNTRGADLYQATCSSSRAQSFTWNLV